MINRLGQIGPKRTEPSSAAECLTYVPTPSHRCLPAGADADRVPGCHRLKTESKIECKTTAAKGNHPGAGRPVSGVRLRYECPNRAYLGVLPVNLPELTPPFPLPPWSRFASRTPGRWPIGFDPSRRRASTLAPPGLNRCRVGKVMNTSFRMRGPLRSPSTGARHRDGRWWGPTCPDCA